MEERKIEDLETEKTNSEIKKDATVKKAAQ